QALDNGFISFSEEKMNLRVRPTVFDSTYKVRGQDGVPNEGRLDDENSFRRGVSHRIDSLYSLNSAKTMEKITAIIPTFNEEVHIKEAIESVLWCDEIIVVDSFSTDRTVEIVKSFPQVRLLQHEYEHSAAQKNWTIPQAQNDWMFLLDADGRPTPELAEKIHRIVKTGTNHSGFWIYRRNN